MIRVAHIARLARLRLDEGAEAKFERELDGIVRFVAKLSEADTAGVAPTAGGGDGAEALRADDSAGLLPADSATLVESAPARDGGFIAARAVFEHRS